MTAQPARWLQHLQRPPRAQAFASTANLAVPFVMHFAIDFVSFAVCHVQVVRGGEEKQQLLLAADFPIARMFREMASWVPRGGAKGEVRRREAS